MSRSFSPPRKDSEITEKIIEIKPIRKKSISKIPKWVLVEGSTLTYLDDPLCDLTVFSSVVKNLGQVILQCWWRKQLGSYWLPFCILNSVFHFLLSIKMGFR